MTRCPKIPTGASEQAVSCPPDTHGLQGPCPELSVTAPEASRCGLESSPSCAETGLLTPPRGLCSQAGAGIDLSGTGADSHPNLHRDRVSPSAPRSRLRGKTGPPTPTPAPGTGTATPRVQWGEPGPKSRPGRWAVEYKLTASCPAMWHMSECGRNVPHTRRGPGHTGRFCAWAT